MDLHAELLSISESYQSFIEDLFPFGLDNLDREVMSEFLDFAKGDDPISVLRDWHTDNFWDTLAAWDDD